MYSQPKRKLSSGCGCGNRLAKRSKRSKKRSCKYGKSKRKSKSGRKKCLKSKRRSKKRSMKKSKRRSCWKGYRRVPGTKRGSKGSCKKIKKRMSYGSKKKKYGQKKMGNLSGAFCIKNLYDMESKHDFEGYKKVLKSTKGLDFSRSPALKAYHKEMIKQIKKSRSPILKRDPEIYALIRK